MKPFEACLILMAEDDFLLIYILKDTGGIIGVFVWLLFLIMMIINTKINFLKFQ